MLSFFAVVRMSTYVLTNLMSETQAEKVYYLVFVMLSASVERLKHKIQSKNFTNIGCDNNDESIQYVKKEVLLMIGNEFLDALEYDYGVSSKFEDFFDSNVFSIDIDPCCTKKLIDGQKYLDEVKKCKHLFYRHVIFIASCIVQKLESRQFLIRADNPFFRRLHACDHGNQYKIRLVKNLLTANDLEQSFESITLDEKGPKIIVYFHIDFFVTHVLQEHGMFDTKKKIGIKKIIKALKRAILPDNKHSIDTVCDKYVLDEKSSITWLLNDYRTEFENIKSFLSGYISIKGDGKKLREDLLKWYVKFRNSIIYRNERLQTLND